MNNAEQIKQLLSPSTVVTYYIGQPQKTSGKNLIYKSPFRNERTASFWVNDEKGIHDFGTDIHYDIISFVQELFKIDFKTAINKLCSDFGIINYSENSKELKSYLLEKRKEELQIMKKINQWFYDTFDKLCKKIQKLEKIVQNTKGAENAFINCKVDYLEYLIEIFIDASEGDKIELWKNKEEIEKWTL